MPKETVTVKPSKKDKSAASETILHVILGTKGGVGKSTYAVHLADWFASLEIPHKLLDMDDENATLARFFPAAERRNSRKLTEKDSLVTEFAESGQYALVLADLRAGSGDEMLDWFKDVPFDYLAEKGIKFVCHGSVTSDPDSVSTLINWANAIGDAVKYVVVKNYKDGNEIPALDRTEEGEEFLRQFTPAIIQLQAVPTAIMSLLNARNLSFGNALNTTEQIRGVNDSMMRGRLARWQKEIFAQFAAHTDLLLGV